MGLNLALEHEEGGESVVVGHIETSAHECFDFIPMNVEFYVGHLESLLLCEHEWGVHLFGENLG